MNTSKQQQQSYSALQSAGRICQRLGLFYLPWVRKRSCCDATFPSVFLTKTIYKAAENSAWVRSCLNCAGNVSSLALFSSSLYYSRPNNRDKSKHLTSSCKWSCGSFQFTFFVHSAHSRSSPEWYICPTVWEDWVRLPNIYRFLKMQGKQRNICVY